MRISFVCKVRIDMNRNHAADTGEYTLLTLRIEP